MSYEEPKYKTVKTTDVYEIREYGDRLAVEIEYSNEDSGFRYLFNYISGENKNSEKVKMTVPVTQSVKINMTTPVTQSTKGGKMKMQFFLPSKFTLENAPQPNNERVNLIIIKGGVYAVISYSGRLTNRNYSKHYKKIINHLNKDNIDFIEPAIRATFNGPFTLPIFRRNEIMIKIKYNEIN
jgi:effector-binding domain-containing protein